MCSTKTPFSLLRTFRKATVASDDLATANQTRRYANHVGIHYVLCSKLRQFSYDEIEFFLPQLCHLIISVDNESMALEEFILDLCEESVNAALLVSPRYHSRGERGANLKKDILALPDIPPRPFRESAVRSLQDVPTGVQQSPAHRVRAVRALPARAYQGKCAAGNGFGQLCAGEYCSPISAQMGRTSGDCAGKATAEQCRCHLRCESDAEGSSAEE